MKKILLFLFFAVLGFSAQAQSATTFDARCDSLCMAQKRLDLQILEIQYQKSQLSKVQVNQATAVYEAANEAYLSAVVELDYTLQNQIAAYTRLIALQKAELYAKFKAKFESQINSQTIERCTDRCPPPIR